MAWWVIPSRNLPSSSGYKRTSSLSAISSIMYAFTLKTRVLFLILLLVAVPAYGQEGQAVDTRLRLTLEDIHASGQFYGESFRGGRWTEEGPVITYIERENGATHLIRYNLETNSRERLIDGNKLRAPDVDRLIQFEDYQYSTDGKKVLLFTDTQRVWRMNTKGYYYIYDLESDVVTPVSERDKGYQMFAKISPDGRNVAFVRDRNLFLVDLGSREEKQLTFDGSEGAIINGTSDWVYEEEFGLRDGWKWSPDGRYIAFFQFDESETREFLMADLRGLYPDLLSFRYPKAGEANSEIHVGVIDISTGEIRFFDTDTWFEGGEDYEYIPQMGWTPQVGGKYLVWMFRLNRDQNKLDLLYADPEDASVRTVLHEESDSWLDVETGFSDLDVGNLTYLQDGKHFVWLSDRDGFRHLYLYENDGTFVRQITKGEWAVTEFHGIDESTGAVYFTATKESPLERHLYRAELERDGEPVKITKEAGWHGINMSRDHRYYIDTYSNVTTPPVVTLHRSDGEQINVLEDNESLIALLEEYDLPKPEFLTVPGADGVSLNAYIIKPREFDPNRQYPLLLHVYGGPGSQEVRNQWAGTEHLWHIMLAEEYGVLVAGVDNRGTGGRGKAFESAVYKQLGKLEAADQIAAAQYFGSLPYIDAERMGIWGWSYGGYATLMSMLTGEGPETFKVGIAVAPVSDWRLYDTIYTERFMSTPQKNPEGYKVGSPINHVKNLRSDQKLLIVHGDFDDNVHFQNAIQVADALQAANKQFSLMVYPGRNHGIAGGVTRLHLYTLLTNFITENLLK